MRATMSRIYDDELYQSRYGGGIGSLFAPIFRALIPIAKSAFGLGKDIITHPTGQKLLQQAKRTAIDAGLEIAHDALSGKKVKEAMQVKPKTKKLKAVKKRTKVKKMKKAKRVKKGNYKTRKKPAIQKSKRKKSKSVLSDW